MSKYRKQDIETMLRLQLGEAEKAKVIAQQTVERLEQQVAQSREEVSKLKCELSEWKLASAANETGHLFRCARVNGKWSCAKGCLAIAHTTLRGLVRDASYHIEQVEADLHTALNGTRHDPSWIRPIQLSRNERQELYFTCQKQLAAIRATLPREGGAQDTISTKTLPSQYPGNCAEVRGDIS